MNSVLRNILEYLETLGLRNSLSCEPPGLVGSVLLPKTIYFIFLRSLRSFLNLFLRTIINTTIASITTTDTISTMIS